MRITPSEIAAFVSAITPFLKANPAELRLYGSRTKDHLKGGDIDILLLVKNENLVKEIKMKQHHILAGIKKQIGERKIDLLIASENEKLSDEFLKLIFSESIVLYQWASYSSAGLSH